MKSFEYQIPTGIFFGKKELERLDELLPKESRRILIVTDLGLLNNTGHISRIIEILGAREIVVFSAIEENPTLDSVKKGIGMAERNSTDFILGVGGGSAMDVAKGVANRVENRVENPVPFACIPTSSGTGSEATPYAVFTDPDKKTKVGFSNESYFPVFSIIDPELTYSMPQNVILNTGLDALAHALEAYFSLKSSILSDHFALHAMDQVIHNLPEAVHRNHGAMDKMAYAAMISGMAIAHTSTILPHIMGYPLTVYHKVPHGRASVLLTPAYLDFLHSQKVEEDKLDVLNAKFKRMDGLRGFLKMLDVPLNLTAYGVKEKDLDHYSAQTFRKDDVRITPGPIHEKNIRKIYEDSM